MAWDWEKLQQQKKSGGGGPPPQVGDVLDKIKGAKGKFPGAWIIIVLIVVLYLASSMIYRVSEEGGQRGIVQRPQQS